MNTLFTIGYGNDPPEKFLARLKAAGVTVVLDVRRYNSKARLRCYDSGRRAGMSKLLAESDITYWEYSFFSNRNDTLLCYAAWLKSSCMCDAVELLANTISCIPSSAFCLLCAERDAYKDGEVNCHRVYVADALVKLLGAGWSVEHL